MSLFPVFLHVFMVIVKGLQREKQAHNQTQNVDDMTPTRNLKQIAEALEEELKAFRNDFDNAKIDVNRTNNTRRTFLGELQKVIQDKTVLLNAIESKNKELFGIQIAALFNTGSELNNNTITDILDNISLSLQHVELNKLNQERLRRNIRRYDQESEEQEAIVINLNRIIANIEKRYIEIQNEIRQVDSDLDISLRKTNVLNTLSKVDPVTGKPVLLMSIEYVVIEKKDYNEYKNTINYMCLDGIWYEVDNNLQRVKNNQAKQQWLTEVYKEYTKHEMN